MDLAFFDPDTTHADHLRVALEAHVAADARRAAKYGVVSVATTASDDDVNHDDDCYLWPRGTTPDDVRAAYDDRLSAAMRELREATVESDAEEDGDRVGVQPLPRAIAGKGWKGDLATPPSSGDEGEERVAVGGKRKRGCDEDAMLECEGGGAKRLRVDTDFTRLGQHLATPQFSPKRKSHAPRRISRSRKLTAGIQLYNTHSMTTRSKARKSRSSG